MQPQSVEKAKALMKWFKTIFFKWIDKPPCPICKQDKDNILPLSGNNNPTPEEA
jgi:hypothetical protein